MNSNDQPQPANKQVLGQSQNQGDKNLELLIDTKTKVMKVKAKVLKIRYSLAFKILVLLLGLSTVAIVCSAILSFLALQSVSTVALAGNRQLGESAVEHSTRALVAVAEENLVRRVQNQAEISDAVFSRIETQAKQLATVATRVFNDPRYNIVRPGDAVKEKQQDITAFSSHVLAPGVTYESVRDELNYSGELDNFFNATCANEPILLAAHISTAGGMLRTFPWRSGWAADFDPRVRDWYVNPIKNRGIAWTGPYISKSTGKLLVTCSMPFYGPGDKVLGVIKLDITPKTINDAIINARVGKSGYAFLLDPTGEVIASPKIDVLRTMVKAKAPEAAPSALDKKLRDPPTYDPVDLLAATDPALLTIAQRMVKKERGFSSFHHEGAEHCLAFAPVPSTGWSIGVVMPLSEIIAPAQATATALKTTANESSDQVNHSISQSVRLMALLFIAVLLLSAWAATEMARRIVKPIQELSDGASLLGAGKLSYQLQVSTGDEIEKLANDFNAMVGNLKVFIANIGEATAARERVQSELQIATKIQISLLPRVFPPFPTRKEIDLFASMDAAREVGGDFFDFFLIDEDRVCLAIGDVSDKGVPSALFMAVTKTLIKTEALQPGRSAAEVLSRVNNQLCEENELLLFVTAFVAIFNMKTGELEYSNAGHNPPVYMRKGAKAAFMNPGKGIALAVMEGAKFKTGRDKLNPGDTFFMYTDGVNEAMDSKREQFSYDRLLAVLDRNCEEDALNITKGMRAAIKEFAAEAPQSDDVTMITLCYKGPVAPA